MAGTKKRKGNNVVKPKEKVKRRLSDEEVFKMAETLGSNKSKQKKLKGVKGTGTPKEVLKDGSRKGKGARERKLMKTTVDFLEDEEMFTMEVEGQDTEFPDEDIWDENEEQNYVESESNSEIEDEAREISLNNNAVISSGRKGVNLICVGESEASCDSEADTVKDSEMISLNSHDKREITPEQEVELFEKWENYMRQKGLLKEQDGGTTNNGKEFGVQPGTSNEFYQHKETSKKINKVKDKSSGRIITSPSETTIYKTAVEKANSNRLSSLSEEVDSGEGQDLNLNEDNVEDLINDFVGKQRLAVYESEQRRESRHEHTGYDDRRHEDRNEEEVSAAVRVRQVEEKGGPTH